VPLCIEVQPNKHKENCTTVRLFAVTTKRQKQFKVFVQILHKNRPIAHLCHFLSFVKHMKEENRDEVFKVICGFHLSAHITNTDILKSLQYQPANKFNEN
jgi:hypothetical protein